MKRFVINIFLFTLFFLGIDSGFGMLDDFLLTHVTSGENFKNKYICDFTKEDLLIMGSSRGVHHYNPFIIEDSLHLTCYNCAYDGCGIITAYGLLNILTEHYSPKYLLYEVTPEFDYLKDDKDNSKYLGPLKLFYDRKNIDSIFISIDKKEQYKMQSKLYRVNSKFIQLLTETYTNRNNRPKGYYPVDKVMEYEPEIMELCDSLAYDSLKIDCLVRIVKLCKQKDIKLIFYVSPLYKATTKYKYVFIEKFAEENSIPYVNHSCDTVLNKNKNYFYDRVHMNRIGATEYTKQIMPELRTLMNIEN